MVLGLSLHAYCMQHRQQTYQLYPACGIKLVAKGGGEMTCVKPVRVARHTVYVSQHTRMSLGVPCAHHSIHRQCDCLCVVGLLFAGPLLNLSLYFDVLFRAVIIVA